jgi:prepilin-type processing-associated H-X9-DG protein
MFWTAPPANLIAFTGGAWVEYHPTQFGGDYYPAYMNGWGGSGVMGVNTKTPFTAILDGTSNTVLIDELRIGPSANDIRGTWAMGQCGASISAANGRNDGPMPNVSLSGWDDIWQADDRPDIGMGACTACGNWQVTAKSRHPGGVNVAMCDGSVRFVRNVVSQRTWFLLHSRNDGQVLGDDW